jgi:hypothetical protein
MNRIIRMKNYCDLLMVGNNTFRGIPIWAPFSFPILNILLIPSKKSAP